MPKYYFDLVNNGQRTTDDEGTELPSKHDAHRNAIRVIADSAADLIPLDGPLKLTIEVKDERRRPVLNTHVWFEPGE